jgi:hypothetical protein
MRDRSARTALLALFCICFTACVHVGHQQEQPWQLFTLSPLPAPKAQQERVTRSPGPVQPVIGVGPIRLPGYLDQDQIVTRISPNHVTLSEKDRWAEPLRDNIAQVLAQNLSMLLQTDQVVLHPWSAQQRPAYQLEIDVMSFEIDSAGPADLTARWVLRDVASRQTIADKETRLTSSARGTSSELSVASLSKALGDFSIQIAKVIGQTVQHCTPQSGAGQRETGLLRSALPRP